MGLAHEMQRDPRQLARQQELLTALGFYSGEIDSIWGPATIEAKKEYERSPLFRGGVATDGLPFSDRKPHPVGISVVFDAETGLNFLWHPSLNV